MTRRTVRLLSPALAGLALLLLAPAAAQQAAPPLDGWPRQPAIAVPPALPAAPVIDGHVNYKEWFYAAHVGGFMDLDAGAATARPVSLYLCYDAAALYVGLVISRPPLNPTPRATFEPGPHEHLWWKDDNFELVVEPGEGDGLKHGYAFCGNSIGGWSDLRYLLAGGGSSAAWTGQWEYQATRAGRDNWHAELKIPVAQFDGGQPPAPGVDWRLAVMNQQVTPRKAMIDWSYMWSFGQGGYASPNKAHLRFVDARGPIVRLSELGKLRPVGKDAETKTERCGVRMVLYSHAETPLKVRCRGDLYRCPEKRPAGVLTFYDLWDRLLTVRATGQPLRDPKDPTQAFRNEADLLRELNERYTHVASAEVTLPIGKDKPGYFPLQPVLQRGEYVCAWRVSDPETNREYVVQVTPFQILPALDLQLQPYFLTHHKLRVNASVADVAREGDRIQVALAVGGKSLGSAETPVPAGAESVKLYLDTKDWPEGQEGAVTAALVGADGQARERSEARLTRPATPSWYGRNLGRSAVVPPPFEPVRCPDARTAAVWGRTYRFGPNGLPASITTRGAELLARPVQLAPSPAGAALQRISADDRDAVFESVAAGEVTRTVRTTVHYDGCLRCDVTLTPRGRATLGELVLDVPLKPEYADLFTHAATSTDFAKLKTDGLGGGLAKWFARYPDGRMPFTFAFFLGARDRGVQWFCESDRGWSNERPDQVIELRRGADEVALRVHFIDRPVTLTEPLRLTFGLMVTPTKDATAGRAERLIAFGQPAEIRRDGLDKLAADLPMYRERGGTLISSYMNDPDHFGQPYFYNAEDEALMKDFAALCHRHGLTYRPYNGWGVHTNTPQFETFGVEMLREPWRNAGWGVYWHNPASTFGDWWLNGVEHLVKVDGFDGIYMDGTCGPELIANELDGFAWTDASGNAHGSYPIWAIRDFIERLYVLLHHELRPDGVVDLHDGREPLYFINVFADTTVSGEYHLSRGKTVLEVFDPDEFSAYYLTHLNGNARRFIWWNWMKLPILRNEIQSMALLHDTPLPVGGGIIKHYGTQVGYAKETRPWVRLAKLRDAVGSAEFLGYWSAPPVTCAPAGPLSSLWVDRAAGRLLWVVSNLATEQWTGSLRVDPAKLGLPADAEWLDAMFDLPLGIKAADPLRLTIEPQRYRLFALNVSVPLPENVKRDGSDTGLVKP